MCRRTRDRHDDVKRPEFRLIPLAKKSAIHDERRAGERQVEEETRETGDLKKKKKKERKKANEYKTDRRP